MSKKDFLISFFTCYYIRTTFYNNFFNFHKLKKSPNSLCS